MSFPGSSIPGLSRELGGFDGSLTFDEAVVHVNGLRLKGPELRPVSCIREPGEVKVGDLPVRFLEISSGKIELFCDAVQHVKVDVSQNFFEEKLVKECNTANYKALPEPFRLRSGPKVPYTVQMIILPASPPPDCDPATTDSYVHIFKHVYLHRNKANAKDCIDMCFGLALKFDWGTHTRLALMALTYMMDKMGGKQIRDWVVQPKFEKKATIDEDARKAGYRFIREHGLQANNVNQFMEWTDTKIHEAGSPIENWQESKVITALHNYSRGRQNATTLESWPFTLKSMTGWFFDGILVHMLGSIRQHGITWIGKTRTGKSLGSKTVAFCQSKYEIEQADRDDLSPAIVTAKHLDFFKSEPVSKFKPAIFDDGMLQKMDASFL